MTIEDLKDQFFKLSLILDADSVRKDYDSLRIAHYANQKWIIENGLQEEYYNYFYKNFLEDRNNG